MTGDIYVGGVLVGRVTEWRPTSELASVQLELFPLIDSLPEADEFVPGNYSCTFRATRPPVEEEGDDA